MTEAINRILVPVDFSAHSDPTRYSGAWQNVLSGKHR